MVREPPTMQEMQETWIRSLSQEDPLGDRMAAQSRTLAWRIPWTEEPGSQASLTEETRLSD